MSALVNCKLDGFSEERLMTFLTRLDQGVEIVIRKNPRSRAAARISSRQSVSARRRMASFSGVMSPGMRMVRLGPGKG